ncbi:leucine-rich repeat-containing protein 15-like [Pollicipes pollicipes]|uniref:leucine-rich repeat-containing protein 15-like n=1 Tax=Pollicipes pollicipes TaxID=41117 RepID=UPI001884D9A6|nr:leucine-rich repeat-containing protein 15-like [Pollicipes pollicipes]
MTPRPPPAVTSVTLVTLVGLASLLDLGSARCPGQCRCDRKISDCSHARLDTVPIILNPRIHILRLQGNNIGSIEDTLGFYAHLLELDLSNNSLDSLLEQQFVRQGDLQRLNLRKNRVTGLMRSTFEGLDRLTELDLSDNMLTTLEAGVFKWMERLKHLNLARNRIRMISRDAFENVYELLTLELGENDISHVPSDAFRHLGTLRVLRIGHNSLQEVPFHAFFMLQSLRNLTLAHNRIYRIHPEAFADLLELRRLDIGFNELDKFPATSLALPGLEVLHAGGNRFSSLHVHHMDSLHRLRVLRVCHSQELSSVTGHIFSNNLLLEEVHLCENPQLTWFPPAVVNTLPNLKVLNLGGNSLGTLENMTSLLQRVEAFNVSGQSPMLSPIRCVDSGRLLTELSEADLGCGTWLAPLLVAVAAFVLVFCAIFVALLLLRRRRRRDRQLTCIRDVRSYSNQWEDMLSDADDVKGSRVFGDEVKASRMFTQVDPDYGSLSRLEHFTFQSPEHQKKIPVTVV